MTSREKPIGVGMFFSPAELQGVREASRILLSPGEYSKQDEWRADALRTVVDCLGADMGFFMYRSSSGETYSVDQDIPRADEYPGRVKTLAAPLRLWERQLELTVWSRPLLWRRHLPDMLRSEYYLDFVRPLRGFDTIGLSVPIDSEGSLATFHLHHASERGARFGERGLALLRLIEPAFRVGVSLSLSGRAPTSVRRRRSRDLKSVLPMLSSRELSVVELLAERRTNREIAEALGVRPGTIKRHVENILQKTGVRSRREIEPLLDGQE